MRNGWRRRSRICRSLRPRRIEIADSSDWKIVALSGAGIAFILLGLTVLALPASQEGDLVITLTPEHALHIMDIAGAFLAGLGVVLTWLGGMLWQRQMKVDEKR